MHDKIQRFSLRKLSVGLASVMVGACIFSVNGKTVKADVTSDQTTQATKAQGQTATAQPQSNDVQNEKQQTSSAQNSVADQSQKNLMDDLGKQKTSAQLGDQAEAKNQENRLVDQINYKLTNNTSTDNKEDLGQNKVAPDETKQDTTTKSDAEKSIVSSSSTPKINNQSNDHADDNSQTQSQKLDITKISQQLNQKELATNLTQDNSSQKDYTPDISAWTGHDDGTYYILDKYTPQNDAEKDLIIIPNEADFEKAGKNINGHEVGITSDTTRAFMTTVNPKEVHFSETNGKKIKAINDSWLQAFKGTNLEAITGKSLDTTNVKTIAMLFQGDRNLNDISALSSWDVSNVSGLGNENDSGVGGIFQYCNSLTDISPISNWHFTQPVSLENAFQECTKLVDLSPLTNWDVSTVWNFGHTFFDCHSLTDLSPLKNWNTKNVKYWDNMFINCPNLTNIDAINNWNYVNAIVSNGGFGAYPLDDMFNGDHKIQINIGTDSGLADFIRRTGRIDAFHNSSNQITTSNTKLIELLTNTDFQAQNETATAKRTITFTGLPANRAIPPIVQVINYTKLATAIIDMTGTSDANAHGKIVSSGFEKDWKLDTSKQNDDVIIDGVINFKPIKVPHINGYKFHLIKDPVNPTAFLVSFIALPQNNQSTSNEAQTSQSPQKDTQDEQKQPEPIQTTPAEQEQEDKQIDQLVRTISYTLMHNDSSDTADSFEPAQNDSAPLEAPSDSTQNSDAAKPQKVNAAKHKKHIVKKRVVKRHKKHAKKYHLKRRSRKHTKRAKKRIIKHRKSVSRKFRKHNLKHVKKN